MASISIPTAFSVYEPTVYAVNYTLCAWNQMDSSRAAFFNLWSTYRFISFPFCQLQERETRLSFSTEYIDICSVFAVG